MERVRAAVIPLLIVLLWTLSVSGCANSPQAGQSAEVPVPVRPASVDLSSPKAAVASYLDWTTFAYGVGSSDVASLTMSPEEEVRVNSYVQLNTERQQRISQVLVSFEPRTAIVDGTRATLGAGEVWKYRYLSTDGTRALSETLTASYEVTYNVVLARPGRWVVDGVDVRPLSEVK